MDVILHQYLKFAIITVIDFEFHSQCYFNFLLLLLFNFLINIDNILINI